jgi:hypothetical protein
MDLEILKKTITEAVGADEAAKVVESLSAYRKTLEDGITAQVTEGVKAEKIKLEADYLQKLEESKTEADKKVKAELTVYEKQLAARVKMVLEKSLDAHGDRLAKIQEETSAKRGSLLLQEVESLVTKAKAEITETAKAADPKELTALKTEVASLKEAIAAEKKVALEARARANVAEQEAKALKESLDSTLNVVVEDIEPTKTKPAGEEHHDVTGKKEDPVVEGTGSQKPAFSASMERMRALAGIKPKA